MTAVRKLAPRFALAILATFAIQGAAPATAQVTKAEELRYPPLRDIQPPKPERFVLDNGLTVFLLVDRELPTVEATALIRTGSNWEPVDKVGLAELVGATLRTGGTQAMSGDEVDDFLESRAATIESRIGGDLGSANLSCLKEDFADVFRVFADVLRRPVFDNAKFEVARNRATADIARRNDDPQEITARELGAAVYGADSPFARDKSYSSLAAIRRADLIAWHQKYFQPQRMAIGIAGDIDPVAALERVRQAFGDWPRGADFSDPEPNYRKEPKPGVYVADKSDVPQSSIVLGHLGLRKDDADFFAIEVANQILGGSFASRLFSNVRTKKALGYIVYGAIGSDWLHPGVTQVGLTTRAETTAAGIDALLEEVRGMVSNPPSEAEVAEAKQAILQSFVFLQESPRRIVLRQQLPLAIRGYPADWFDRYRAAIEAVTVDDVRRVAARHLRPNDLAIVVVGPAAASERPLSTFGTVTAIDLTIPGGPSGKKAPK